MKAVSSSIIVLAGALLLAAGAMINHADTQFFVCSVGTLLGLVGLVAWLTNLRGEH
jgi:hypothetical protein